MPAPRRAVESVKMSETKRATLWRALAAGAVGATIGSGPFIVAAALFLGRPFRAMVVPFVLLVAWGVVAVGLVYWVGPFDEASPTVRSAVATGAIIMSFQGALLAGAVLLNVASWQRAAIYWLPCAVGVSVFMGWAHYKKLLLQWRHFNIHW